jgi:hypothetical protein
LGSTHLKDHLDGKGQRRHEEREPEHADKGAQEAALATLQLRLQLRTQHTRAVASWQWR